MDTIPQPFIGPEKTVKIARSWAMVLAVGWLLASMVDIRAFWIQKNAEYPTEADGWAVWNLGLSQGALLAISDDFPSYFAENPVFYWHPPDSAAIFGFFKIDLDYNWGAMAVGLVYPLVIFGLIFRKVSSSRSRLFKTIRILIAFLSVLSAFVAAKYRVSISCSPMDLKDAPRQCQIFILGDVKVVAVTRSKF